MNLLPSDKIEPIILKLALTYPKYVNLIQKHFDKNWLEDKELGEIVFFVNKFFEKFKKLPTTNTLDLIINKKYEKDREQYLKMMSKLKSAIDIDICSLDLEYIDVEVVNYLKNAGFYWTLINSIDKIQKSHNVQEYMEKMQEISSMTFDSDIGFDYLEDIDEHIEDIKNPESRLSLGIKSLDEVMAGGVYTQGRCLAIFLGQTHVGKSLMFSNIAANLLKQNKFVVIISLEMCERVYGERIDAHLTKEDINKLQFNTEKIKSTAESIKEKHPKSKLIIKEYPPETIDSATIKLYIDKITAQFNRKPDIVLVDYLTLMVPNNSSSEGSYQKYKDVSTELRAATYLLEIPIISGGQLNRQGYQNTEVSLSNTAESMGIPNTADFIAILWQKEGDREAEIINATIQKNRLGGKIGKTLQFNINYSNLTITDLNQTQNPNDHTFVENLLFAEK